MALKLKPLFHQVMVVTGATTDIGSKTIYKAVEQGMKVFMIDMDEEALQVIQDDMRLKGYDTAYSVADVSLQEQLQFSTDQCIGTFGTIDTWVNIPTITKDPRSRQFETHFWGMVNGCNTALPYIRKKGGVIINVGSAYNSDVSPKEHIDSASRQALKGYTDAFRKELKSVKAPVQVSLILSSTPELAADGILRAAEIPTKEIGPARLTIFGPLKERIFKRNENHKGLMATGVGGTAVAGGMAFFLLRKFRIV